MTEMDDQGHHWLERLSAPIYFATFLFVILPLIDFAANVWPLHLGDPAWRYGSGGLLTGFMLTSVFGLVLAWIVAALNAHRRALQVLTVVSAVGAVLLVLLGLEFVLDAFQVRGTVPQANLSRFDAGVMKALFRFAVVAVALFWISVVGWRIWRADADSRGRRHKEPGPLVSAKRAAKGG